MSGALDGDGEWRAAHEALVELARSRAGLDSDEGRWLLAARRSGAHTRLGAGSFAEYIERLFGYTPRLTHDKLRVATALESLPRLAQALREGIACWSCVRELTRVATPETEAIWLAQARDRTVHEVEKLVSGHRLGSLPGEPKEAKHERHVLRFEVSGEAFATFREAETKLRRDAGGHLDDDALLLLMARQILGGPTNDGRASYQIELTVCEACGSAAQLSNGELVEVSPAAAEAASCDSQVLPSAHSRIRARATQQLSPPHADMRDHATAEPLGVHAGGRARAAQGIPPAVRREVLRRDHRCCRVPGCRLATWVDVHHVNPRAAGGDHDPDNLLTLCSAHHHAVHNGELVIEPISDGKLRFQHAEGTTYGGRVSAPLAGLGAKAFRALRGLGFGESEARRAVAETITHVGDDAELGIIVRRAVEYLTEGAWSRAS